VVRHLSVNSTGSFYDDLMLRYNDVFTDKIGRLKGYKVKLHIDPDAKPVQTRYRRPPYHLVKAFEAELDTLMEQKVLEYHPGPVTWLLQFVIVPKPKKPGQVRITVDARIANKAIIREKYPTPTTEEIRYDLVGATVYSEIDFNKAFHQIELADEASMNVTAVETHRGPMRFRTLNMGVHNASEIFQNVVQTKVLTGLKGVRNIADNIIVFGTTRNEHDERLVAVCERIRNCGMTASKLNCKLGVEELLFFGLKLSRNGVAVGDDKVAALLKAGVPTNFSELQSFLGLAVYCSGHIMDLATQADPLWELSRQERSSIRVASNSHRLDGSREERFGNGGAGVFQHPVVYRGDSRCESSGTRRGTGAGEPNKQARQKGGDVHQSPSV